MKKLEFRPEVHDVMPLKDIYILFFQQSKIVLCNFGQEHFGKHSCDSIVMLIKGI